MLPNDEGKKNSEQKQPGPLQCAVPYTPACPKLPPPRPELRLELAEDLGEPGIELKWNLDLDAQYEEIGFYELYAKQEIVSPPYTSQWRKFGLVQALPLPMACTLVEFTEGNYYHFLVRAVDVLKRFGPFSFSSKIQIPPTPPAAVPHPSTLDHSYCAKPE